MVVKRYIKIFNYVENTALFITFPIEVAIVKMEKRITQLTVENHAYKMENLLLRKALNMKAKNNKALLCEGWVKVL